MQLLIADNGRIRSLDDVELAEQVVKLRKNADPWLVIDELVRIWQKKTPEEAQAIKVDVSDQRELLTDKKYGQTVGGKEIERRFYLLFPSTLALLIRTQFKAEELPYDRAFYRQFAKRYPNFRIASHD